MKILALDLGTKTGFCTNAHGSLECGTWQLATAKEITAWGKSRLTRRGDPRICRLLARIAEVGPVDLYIFEDVEFSSFTKQTQLWSSLRACVWLAACQDMNTILECVPVGTLKKFATGNGAADKAQMKAALVRKFVQPINPAWDDNAIDAYWLYYWATLNLGRIKP